MLNESCRRAASEVCAILDHTKQEDVKKIPRKFLEFLQESKSEKYFPNLDFNKPIEELKISSEAEAILGMIYLNYWASEEGKKEFTNRIIENEEKIKKANIFGGVDGQNMFGKKDK